MSNEETQAPDASWQPGEVRYTRELGLRQAISLGLRASVPLLAFAVLGPLTATSGRAAPLALVLGALLWLPTLLSYMELSSQSADGGIYELVAQYRSGLLPFLGAWVLLLCDLLAVGLLVREGASLIQPSLQLFSQSLVPGTSIGSAFTTDIGVIILLAVLVFAIALMRRRPWRLGDDLVLFGGLVGVALLAALALLSQPRAVDTSILPVPSFRTVVSGALFPILILLALEAIGEWQGEYRRAQWNLLRAYALALALLLSGVLVLLVSALRLDTFALASEGISGVIADLVAGPPPVAPALPHLVLFLFLLVLLSGAASLLLQASRVQRQLTREGYLPSRATFVDDQASQPESSKADLPKPGGRGPGRDPRGRGFEERSSMWGATLALALVIGLTLLLPERLTFTLLIGLMVLLSATINVAAIAVRAQRDSNRTGAAENSNSASRKPFLLPFPPLVPALGLVIALFLAFTLAWPAFAGMAGALLVALAIYLLYGAKGHRRVQESRSVFGKKQRQQKRDGAEEERFRILVPLLDSPREQKVLIELAKALARAENGEVLALQVIIIPPQQRRAEGERLARERNQLLQWSLREEGEEGSVLPLTRVGRDPVQAIMDTAREESVNLVLLNWRVTGIVDEPVFSRSAAVERGRLVSDLVRGAACMVAALDGQLKDHPRRILVPTAGGPHAPVAARLALDLARLWGAEVVGLNIVRDESDDEAMALARQVVLGTFEGLPDAEKVMVRLITSGQSIASTLVEEANQDYDLVMLGASNEGLLDRVLFGDIPQQVAEQTETAAIMVRSRRPVQEAQLHLLWDRVLNALPSLDAEEQIDLYRSLRRGARPSINYFVLIVLSALIATFGLWQNSAAVIIGAMLVAPLMTPIVATSLGIVMGDGRTIRVALEATVKGVFLSIAIALFFTILLPEQRVGSEILARTQPTFVDLGVALASGAAGAYALARREVSAALPGVAIAAALMPPLCTVGIGLAAFSAGIAGGAMLLFTTNLIAITVAGSLVFLLLGMRPRRGEKKDRTARFQRGLLLALGLLVIISVPLTWLGVRNTLQYRDQTTVSTWLQAAARSSDAELIQAAVDRRGKVLDVYARVQAPSDAVDQATVEAWQELLSDKTGRPVQLEIDIVPIINLRGGGL